MGAIDILVNNAGIETIVPFLELTDEQWTRLVDVNLRGAWLCSQVFCRRALAEKRLGRAVMSAPLPALSGVPERHYDLIAALDVIEHIDDDTAAIASIARRLKPGGKLLVTVPAHRWMWSAHDAVNHHKRRYSKRMLQSLIRSSPLKLDAIGYFNSLLFPIAVAERLYSKVRGKNDADLALPPKPLNSILESVFSAERYFVGRLPLPPGLSLFAVASAT